MTHYKTLHLKKATLVFLFSLVYIYAVAQCNQNYNWVTWNDFQGSAATGTVLYNGQPISITMTSNFDFSATSYIWGYSAFNNFNGNLPNTTVPATTWSYGAGGTTTMCFSQQVQNPVLMLASLGAPGSKVSLSFSQPYSVVYDGGGMTYSNDTTILGEEGYAIILFPGNFTCVTINSTTPEYYTNITWGLNPPIFPVTISGEPESCDSVVLTASGGVSYSWDGGAHPDAATNTFYESGSYFVTATDVNGCTATAVKTVTIKEKSTATIDQVICEGQSYLGHTASGTYSDTLIAANGCDSIQTTHLTVKHKSTNTINAVICRGQSYEGYTEAGIYTDTFVAANGCDSIRTLHLSIAAKANTTVGAAICNGESYEGYTTAGTYIDTFGTAGCDSIRTLHLSIKQKSYSHISQTICHGQSYFGYTVSGTYIDTLVAANGCDSIRTLTLTVNDLISQTINTSICRGESYEGYTTAGTYVDTFRSVSGCDSVRIINLAVVDIPKPNLGAPVELCEGDTMRITPGSFTSYLWQDSSTNAHYTVKQPGLYKVTVANSCGTATSELRVTQRVCNINFPTAFTPNRDGRNDYFRILNPYGIQNYHLAVYDRWGTKVFETIDARDGWDGTYKGQLANPGTYVWHCNYTKSGKSGTLSDIIVLIR